MNNIIPIKSNKNKEAKDSRFTILEYLSTEFASFEDKPFNEVDALILSQLCYLHFDKIVPEIGVDTEWIAISELYKAELFEQMIVKTLTPALNLKFIYAICASPRFRDIKLNYFLNIYNKTTEEQFSAITCEISSTHQVVAFRGTDLSITGWKEDFNMFFISPVPSQITSVKYLNTIAKRTTGNITLVGHSKGGNLAMYSNAFCKASVHKRVLAVYNLDGPGFPKDILENNDFIKSQDKIIKIVPEGSIIGLMFYDENAPNIIKSHNLGFLQHDPFSWKCDRTKFVKSTEFSSTIRHLDKTFNTWVYELDVAQRKVMVDTIFMIVTKLEVETLDELALSLIRQREELIKSFRSMDTETSNCMKEIFKRFLQISLQTTLDNKKVNEVISKILPK